MNQSKKNGLTRREAIKTTGQVAVASALAGVALPQVHAGEDNTIRIALIGCGGRGAGAASNALRTSNGPTRLVAMADVFRDNLNRRHDGLQRELGRQVNVPEGRRFIGFDGYRRAMDLLRPGDVVILTTPPAFRWVHYTYAIEKRLHVFMEKPITVDGAGTRRMLALADQSDRHNLKVGVGLMCRHCDARKELFQRVRDGQMGDILLLRAYRMHGPVASFRTLPRSGDITELLYQIRNFHSFLWASGGCYSDFYIHNIDECCWIKDAWPVKAQASGGRHYRGNYVDQNFDVYSVEYTFADGAKMYLEGRCQDGCQTQFASLAHGTRGSAIISWSGHTPARARIFRSQNNVISNTADVAWSYERGPSEARLPNPRREADPYQLEWEHLMEAIRRDRPYNEVRRGAEASLVTAMGRMAAHTGREVTRDQCLGHEHDLTAGVDQLTLDSPAPLRAGADGRYPVPQPGTTTRREY